ncbi:MAG: hypothetical protein ACYC0Q_00770 [Eubacteriales bacterium]
MDSVSFVKIRQIFPRSVISDVYAEVSREMAKVDLGRSAGPAGRVAITAGSRGIKNIAVMLRAVASAVRAAGAEPFVVGAMGSHGGGTAEGQKKVLRDLGVTEEAVGCPVHSSDEAIEAP